MTDPSNIQNIDFVRGRLSKLFEFLKAYVDLRYPAVRDVGQQPFHFWSKDLPSHHSIEFFEAVSKTEDESDDQDVVLRITRATITNCPPPPPSLVEWLESGWQELTGKVEVEATRNVVGKNGGTILERFDADSKRSVLLTTWQSQRAEWIENERPARQSLRLFQTVYEWYGAQEREGEKIELLVGDGILNCADNTGNFSHPVLLQRLQLQFFPEKKHPQFIFRTREQPPELYMELLRILPGVDIQQLGRCADELKKGEFTPLGADDTEGFLRRLIQGLFPSGGVMVDETAQAPAKPDPFFVVDNSRPTMTRQPVFYMRARRTGPSNFFDLVLEDIATREVFPASLLQMLGIDLGTSSQTSFDATRGSFANEDEEVLLTKPANRQQLDIAKRLTRSDCVLVQGPPGTGKTHTIANLLGHLLAQGKRVLVTAHTPKALRVLRHKVVEALQPLCISVLQNDKQSQEELQASVRTIHARLSEDDHVLEREAQNLRNQRSVILKALRGLRDELHEARHDEVREVVFGGRSVRPIEAAKRVKDGAGKEDWIPSPVSLGESIPLSHADVVALYQTNGRVTLADERELAGTRPLLHTLPTPEEFRSAIEEMNALADQDLRLHEELWNDTLEPEDLTEFDRMLQLAHKTIGFLRDSAAWELLAVQAGRDGDPARREWDSLLDKIDKTWREVHECQATVMEHGPNISDLRPAHELLRIVDEIIEYREAGNRFGLLTKLTKRHWFEFKDKVRIGSRAFELNDQMHLQAVRALLRMRQLRAELVERWTRQMASQGGLGTSELSERPEQVCKQFIPKIQLCLEWHGSTWRSLENEFNRLGFLWPAYLETTKPETGDSAELRRIRSAVLGNLGAILQSRNALLRQRRLLKKLNGWLDKVPTPTMLEAQGTQRLRAAIRDTSPSNYQAAYEELTRLSSLESDLVQRRALLESLANLAPAWASAIENRVAQHSNAQLPGDPHSAWEWRQLHDELERRASVSLERLQQQIEHQGQELLEVTGQLVEKETWLNQIRRIQQNPHQKQALGAYAALRKKLTKSGKGVRDVQVRVAARREMAMAKDAVPVWIMPLAEVADTFDPRKQSFDVVIIDEASQCDPTSIFALYLGRQTIIVGDDEQVTPIAVGMEQKEVTKLIGAFLHEVPHKELYDGETSVYELAQIAFGGVIRLTEHFRCVPNIIAFSNNLSYKGEIKPLREATSISLTPHVVPYRVEGALNRGDNVNEVEAEYIASLICAAIEQPEYAKNEFTEPTSFGVVSLLGGKQALQIDSLLRQRLEPADYNKRQILCGDSAQFQGDERDVMFLSVVDSPPEDRRCPCVKRDQKIYLRSASMLQRAVLAIRCG
jgi:hypothetical protein